MRFQVCADLGCLHVLQYDPAIGTYEYVGWQRGDQVEVADLSRNISCLRPWQMILFDCACPMFGLLILADTKYLKSRIMVLRVQCNEVWVFGATCKTP